MTNEVFFVILGTLTEEEMLDSIDFIELPGRGRCNIYCARYTYDPLKQSPNENPEAELALNAGDYVIIYGEMDEVIILFFLLYFENIYFIEYFMIVFWWKKMSRL